MIISILISIINAIISAIIGAISALIVQRSSNRFNRRALIEGHRIQEYLLATDCSFDALQALEEMGRFLSGRTEPGPYSSQEEIEESRRRDKASAMAFEKLIDALSALQRQAYKIQAIGSKKVKGAADGIEMAANQYLHAVVKQALEDGRFIAKDHNNATDLLKTKIEEFAGAIREDLQIDSLFRDRIRRNKP